MNTHRQTGYALVVVLVVSTALLILAMATLQAVGLSHTDTYSRLHTKLAEEAAEAGAAYAKGCLELSGRVQTWSTGSPLTPRTNCDGTNNGSYPHHVFSNSQLQTRFVVGDLEEQAENSAIISVTGYTETKRGDGSIARTYTHIIKKTVVWPPNLVAQKGSSANQRSCGLLSGNVYCWGTNAYGQLGDGTTNDSLVPVKVVREAYPDGIGTHTVTDIVSGGWTNCLIIETGDVYCWGDNNSGRLGINLNYASLNYSTVPRKVNMPAGQTAVKLGSSSGAYCALTSSSRLYCWGQNADGQVGNNSTANRISPVLIGGPSPSGGFGGLANKTVTDVSGFGAFNKHLCAIAEGKAYCWGRNERGEIGNNPAGSAPFTTDVLVPTAVHASGVLSGKTVTSISGDGEDDHAHTCAMAYTTTPNDAKAYCWGGHGTYGTLGNNTSNSSGSYSKVPVAVYASGAGVLNGKTVTEIATTAVGGCAIARPTASDDNARRAYCWGGHDTRGDGTSGATIVPVAVSDPAGIFTNNPVTNIAGGAHRACALALNRSYCWGANGMGQIGDGTTTHRRTPTESLFMRPRNNEYIF